MTVLHGTMTGAEVDALRIPLKKKLAAISDLPGHIVSFRGTLDRLATVGQAPLELDVYRWFLATLSPFPVFQQRTNVCPPTPLPLPRANGSANVQRTNVCPPPLCPPCTLPPRHVYPSQPLHTTPPTYLSNQCFPHYHPVCPSPCSHPWDRRQPLPSTTTCAP